MPTSANRRAGLALYCSSSHPRRAGRSTKSGSRGKGMMKWGLRSIDLFSADWRDRSSILWLILRRSRLMQALDVVFAVGCVFTGEQAVTYVWSICKMAIIASRYSTREATMASTSPLLSGHFAARRPNLRIAFSFVLGSSLSRSR